MRPGLDKPGKKTPGFPGDRPTVYTMLGQLERSGLAIRSTTQMAGSNATATEYAFCPKPRVSLLLF